ASE
ncbi:putative transposase family protein, partial [Escherichia coli 95.0943]